RITGIGARRHDVLGYHRTGTDDHIIGDGDRHDGGVGADRDAVADHRFAPQLFLAFGRPADREGVVDEHHAMADEAVLADGHEFADEGMRLYARARTDLGALLDLGEGTDEAIVADAAAIEIAGLHHLRARAEGDVADAGLVQLGLVHD